MNRLRPLFLTLLLGSALLSAQAIPGRYIVEFNDAPALAATARPGARLAQSDTEVTARRTQIQTSHALAMQSIQGLGGTIRARFDLVFNGMAVDVADAAVDRLRQLPNVRAVYPVMQYRAHLDHAVNVHQIRDAWQVITGGQAGAGAGIKVGILDSGIDNTHPAFQSFTTEVPSGFPKLSSEAMRPFANNKVIVVRDYTGEGGTDLVGHGTGVAMAAAGGRFDPKVLNIPPFTGVAPGAWLGNYHVISQDGTSNSALFIQALQDAVSDGMNVINYSAGGPALNVSEETGPQARAISTALAAGVIAVISAGNDGPEPGTAHIPGASADALTVGANLNERVFDVGVTVADLPGVAAEPGSNSTGTDVIQANLVDIAALDPTGLACSALPPASLKNKFALISRGTCPFDDKANNAEAAGAVGIVVYNNDASGGLIRMSVPTATLATMFVTNASGLAIKTKLASTPDALAVLDFAGSTAVPTSSDDIAYFSAGGPTVGALIKPDVLAVGSWVVTANTTQGTTFNVAIEDGTSFSSPIVTGAVAALMAARPGLTAAQYRSLIVNSAPLLKWPSGEPVSPQISGNGKLNLLRAVQSPTVASPTSLNFQAASGAFDLTRSIVITNLGEATDTFSVTITPVNKTGAIASVDADTFTLNKGQTKTIVVRLQDGAPATGEVQGYIEVTGTKTAVSTRVPYWLGVRGSGPKTIAILSQVDFTARSFGDQVSFYLRVLDSTGLPVDLTDVPAVTSASPRATLLDIGPAGTIPGTYRATVRVGRADANGLNVFTIQAGDAQRQVVFVIQ